MPSEAINIIGQRFGRLLILERAENKNPKSKDSFWLCKCDCGNTKVIGKNSLRIGAKSCGCLSIEKLIDRSVRHGMTIGGISAEYAIWNGIRERCYNPNHLHFEYYGGRGISMCKRWLESASNFLEDMGSRPSPQHSIDRFPDKNGNYEPSNCRWATLIEQASNRRNNVYYEYNGISKTLSFWARELKANPSSIQYWIKKGFHFSEVHKHLSENKQKWRSGLLR